MEYRQLGRTGMRVSVVGLGGNVFGARVPDVEATRGILAQARELGINFIDTADIYTGGKSETLLGEALEGYRDDFVIATKVGMQAGARPNEHGPSRKHILESCELSLRRLRIEALDLYQIHAFDPLTPLDETLGALDDLVRAGKVRYIGCSNYDAWRVVQSLWTSEREHFARYVTVQPEYNLLERDIERELVPTCQEFGLGVIPYFPLAAGILTGKYKPGEPAPENSRGHNNPRFASRLQQDTLQAVQRLDAWAQERGHSVAELAVAWLVGRPAVSTVITGTTRPEQVVQNATAAEWHLDEADYQAVDEMLGR